MIFSHHCYNHRWRQQMGGTYICIGDHYRVGLNTINTAEDLLAADLDGEALGEYFAALSIEEQARYLDLRELDCSWSIIGLEH